MTGKRYWLTPPEIYEALDAEFGFDFDPCPYPLPAGFNGLKVPCGRMSFVNPPFRPHDGRDDQLVMPGVEPSAKGPGPTAFVHKAIAEYREHGRGSVLLLPVQSYVMLLAEAGAKVRSMGRVKWLEAETGEPSPSPSPIVAFILDPSGGDDPLPRGAKKCLRCGAGREWLA